MMRPIYNKFCILVFNVSSYTCMFCLILHLYCVVIGGNKGLLLSEQCNSFHFGLKLCVSGYPTMSKFPLSLPCMFYAKPGYMFYILYVICVFSIHTNGCLNCHLVFLKTYLTRPAYGTIPLSNCMIIYKQTNKQCLF